MAVNLTTTYSPLIADRFKQQSFTDAFAGKKYTFDGSKSIVVYTVNKATLNDYDRETSPAAGSRFGTIAELGDTTQTLMLTQDKSFTFSVDSGNNADQLNIKQCNEQLKSNWDEVCTPAIDTYRLSVWADGAGQTATSATALDADTALVAIVTGCKDMNNRLVPKKKRVLFVSESVYIFCKLSTAVLGIPNLGEKAIINGVVGSIDGMSVVPVPDSIMPTGVNFIIKYVDATVDPLKLKVLRVQKNPLGIDGDVGECRFYHDAFVLDARADGVFVHSTNGCVTPTGDAGSTTAGKLTFTTETSGATIYYTTDGSNPKTSETAAVYNSASKPDMSSSVGTHTVRAYALKSGLLNSGILTFTYTVS